MVRTCVGCRRTAAPDKMVRVVRTPEGGVAAGRTLPGRGAWVHRSQVCVRVALQREAFNRALRSTVPQAQLSEVLAGVCEDGEFNLQQKKGCR